MNVAHTRMAMIFDEWNRRYHDDPEAFMGLSDSEGNPVIGFGELCATYFTQIAEEMDAIEALPKAPIMEQSASTVLNKVRAATKERLTRITNLLTNK